MNYRDWPREIGGNMFSLAKLDPATPPVSMKVVTWSNVFSEGGNVSIEAYDAQGKRFGSGFGSITVDRYGSVAAERAHLQDLLDDFTSDLPGNWRDLIEGARVSVAVFFAKQAAEYGEKAADAAAGVFR